LSGQSGDALSVKLNYFSHSTLLSLLFLTATLRFMLFPQYGVK